MEAYVLVDALDGSGSTTDADLPVVGDVAGHGDGAVTWVDALAALAVGTGSRSHAFASSSV